MAICLIPILPILPSIPILQVPELTFLTTAVWLKRSKSICKPCYIPETVFHSSKSSVSDTRVQPSVPAIPSGQEHQDFCGSV